MPTTGVLGTALSYLSNVQLGTLPIIQSTATFTSTARFQAQPTYYSSPPTVHSTAACSVSASSYVANGGAYTLNSTAFRYSSSALYTHWQASRLHTYQPQDYTGFN